MENEEKVIKTNEPKSEVEEDSLNAKNSQGRSRMFPKFFGKNPSLIVALVISVGIIIGLVAILLSYKSSSQLNIEADQAYRSGEVLTSGEKLKQSYSLDKKNPDLAAALIKTLALQGNLTGDEKGAFEKASPIIEESLKTNPNNPNILLSVGYINETAGNYDIALSYYDKVLALKPDDSEALFHKGHVNEFLENQEEAYVNYEKAYSIDKNNPLILMGMAKVYISRNKIDDAITLYKQVGTTLSATPDIRAEALTNASILKRSQILYMQEAIDLSKTAVDVNPNFSPALAAHGYNLGINGRLDEGVEYLKKATVANPRISQNYYYIGVLYRSVNKFDDAKKYQEEGLSKIDNDNTILGKEYKAKIKGNMSYDLAKTYSLLNQNDSVVGLIEQAVSLNPVLKQTLKNDFNYLKQFQSFKTDQKFLALLK